MIYAHARNLTSGFTSLLKMPLNVGLQAKMLAQTLLSCLKPGALDRLGVRLNALSCYYNILSSNVYIYKYTFKLTNTRSSATAEIVRDADVGAQSLSLKFSV